MSRERQAVPAPDAPAPLGHCSPAIRAGDVVFGSGQGPVDPSARTTVSAGLPGIAVEIDVTLSTAAGS